MGVGAGGCLGSATPLWEAALQSAGVVRSAGNCGLLLLLGAWVGTGMRDNCERQHCRHRTAGAVRECGQLGATAARCVPKFAPRICRG